MFIYLCLCLQSHRTTIFARIRSPKRHVVFHCDNLPTTKTTHTCGHDFVTERSQGLLGGVIMLEGQGAIAIVRFKQFIARGIELFLGIHSVINHVDQHLGMSLGLHKASHHPKARP